MMFEVTVFIFTNSVWTNGSFTVSSSVSIRWGYIFANVMNDKCYSDIPKLYTDSQSWGFSTDRENNYGGDLNDIVQIRKTMLVNFNNTFEDEYLVCLWFLQLLHDSQVLLVPVS